MQKTRRNLTICLTRSSLLGLAALCGGCSSQPPAEPVQVHWEFIQTPGQPIKACLPEADVAKLREALIRCKVN